MLLAAAFALLLAAGASAAAEGPKASASAFAALVDLPGGDDTVAGAVSAPPLASANLGGYEYPEDGSVISFARALTGARTGPGSAARAEASASLADVVLFGGEIRIGSVTLRADASATSSGSAGTVSASSLDGVVVLGEPVDAIPNLRVPLGVASDLGLPELAPRAWQAEKTAVVPVPEAPVHEERCAVARKDKIRPARDVCRVQAESEPEPMKRAADQPLRLSITSADAAHHAASCGPVDDVGHYATWTSSSGCTSTCFARKGFIARATSRITGTTTEFPNCW